MTQSPTPRHLLGADLRVGDTIAVWWANKRDTITRLTPYTGKLASLFPKGAQIAEFALAPTGMTIDNEDYYEILSAPTGRKAEELTQGEAALHHPAPECEGEIAARERLEPEGPLKPAKSAGRTKRRDGGERPALNLELFR